jgi:tRNA(Ile2) C34 agmatinyltransferase TiaS
MNGKYIKLHAEIVNGKCPTCHELTILVGLTPEFFRCITCGADLPAFTQTSQMRSLEEIFGHGEKV